MLISQTPQPNPAHQIALIDCIRFFLDLTGSARYS